MRYEKVMLNIRVVVISGHGQRRTICHQQVNNFGKKIQQLLDMFNSEKVEVVNNTPFVCLLTLIIIFCYLIKAILGIKYLTQSIQDEWHL